MKRVVRTPAHFGTLSLAEGVALTNLNHSVGYPKLLTNIFSVLHNVQGIRFPEVDLTSRIHSLAYAEADMIVDTAYFNKRLRHLLLVKLYPAILRTNKETAKWAERLANSYFNNVENAEATGLAVHALVNKLHNDQLVLWNKAIKDIAVANTRVANALNNAGNFEKASSDLDKANANGWDTTKAVAAYDKALADKKLIEEATLEVNSRTEEFAAIRIAMEPLTLLETVCRPLKSITKAEKESDNLHIAVTNKLRALHDCVLWYSDSFLPALEFADKILTERVVKQEKNVIRKIWAEINN
jgi:tetratricopeptide (TPR) repeat protein